jgi:WhiB family redox-sensing transcriptional regulator
MTSSTGGQRPLQPAGRPNRCTTPTTTVRSGSEGSDAISTTTERCVNSPDQRSGQTDRRSPPFDELADALACTSSRPWNAARCRHTTSPAVHLFFSDDIADINQAKRICSTCPVAAQCLQGAFDRHEPCGVWGGYLFANGQILAHKRPRGRPPKHRPAPEITQPPTHFRP